MEKNFLLSTIPFYGFNEEEMQEALHTFRAKKLSYKKNDIILYAGEEIHSFGIVLEGQVMIESIDFLGNLMLLGENRRGDIFAETYAYLGNLPLMVNVRANMDTEVLFLDIGASNRNEGSQKTWFLKFIQNLLTASSQKNVALSQRSFHTRSKSVRSRISSYLSYQSLLHGKMEFLIPLNRQEMADYLNLDRSALSKELGKMKEEGLIKFKKNKFRLDTEHFEVEESMGAE